MKTGLVSQVLRWVLGGVLLWAALSKLANLQEFYSGLSGYQLPLPSAILKLVAIVLPWLELLCGLMLIARIRVRAALLWAMILFGLFAAATGQAWARGFNISCGCLNFDFLGFEGTSFGGFLESAAFACLRALVLGAAAFYLFRTASVHTGSSVAPAPRGQADVPSVG
jgi:putative oxidoreductase